MHTVTRAEVAGFVLDQISDNGYLRQKPFTGISSGRRRSGNDRISDPGGGLRPLSGGEPRPRGPKDSLAALVRRGAARRGISATEGALTVSLTPGCQARIEHDVQVINRP